MTVYLLTNLINKKLYVGITCNLPARISSYKSAAKSNKPSKHRVVLALRKYGFENFKFTILSSGLSSEEAKIAEINFIKQLQSTNPKVGYNVSKGGDLHSDFTKAKMSKTHKGKTIPEVVKQKISNSLKGHAVSDATRKLQSLAKLGKPAATKGKKGFRKANSGSFGQGRQAPLKGRKRFIVDGQVRYLKV
jgi:group I intron endonuclease